MQLIITKPEPRSRSPERSAHPPRHDWRLVLAVLALAALGACGGGGSSSASTPPLSSAPPEEGELIIGITDAPGDFLSYTVDVQSLRLTRSNGDVVETLPLSTRIDFSELTDLTEILTIATVPAGSYESLSLTMDFSNADISIENADGAGVPAVPLDPDGNPMGIAEMRLSLTTQDPIRIAPGTPAAFSLDFDLAASNEVDLAATPVRLTVEPFLLASPTLEAQRDHRVRGVLRAVDSAAGTITLGVRPFRHRSGEFGTLSLKVSSETQYEVDGAGYTGADGLTAMAALPAQAPVIALTSVEDGALAAGVVLAGASVPWTDADVLTGVVTARSGDRLTLSGAQVEYRDGTRVYRGAFELDLSQPPSISAPGVDNAELNADSVSVGQRLVAWGEFTDDQTLLANRIRLVMNQLTGTLISRDPLAINLLLLNRRSPERFDFSGTGSMPEDDADPDFYEIDSGLLPLSTIDSGDLIRLRGLIAPFGTAPADFLARTLIDPAIDSRSARLAAAWPGGTTGPFLSVAPDRLDVDLTEARQALHLRGIPDALLEPLAQIALIAPGSRRGVYTVQVRGTGESRLYRAFDALVNALVAELDAGRRLHRLYVTGPADIEAETLTAARAGFVFARPQDTD